MARVEAAAEPVDVDRQVWVVEERIGVDPFGLGVRGARFDVRLLALRVDRGDAVVGGGGGADGQDAGEDVAQRQTRAEALSVRGSSVSRSPRWKRRVVSPIISVGVTSSAVWPSSMRAISSGSTARAASASAPLRASSTALPTRGGSGSWLLTPNRRT